MIRTCLRASALFLLLAVTAVRADESTDSNRPSLPKPNFPYKDVQTKEGLVFRVPADMAIEVRDGIQAPIPFDEYIYGKFGHIEARISGMDQRLTRIEEKLDRLMASAPIAPVVSAEARRDEAGILKAGVE